MKSFIADFHLKGNPEEPKCGFSKQTVGIFKELEADYGTFDILNDDEVRSHLAFKAQLLVFRCDRA